MSRRTAGRKSPGSPYSNRACDDAARLASTAIVLGDLIRAIVVNAVRVRLDPEEARGRVWRREEIDAAIAPNSGAWRARGEIVGTMRRARALRQLTRDAFRNFPPPRVSAAIDLLTEQRFEMFDPTALGGTSAVEAILEVASRINQACSTAIADYWRRKISRRVRPASIHRPHRRWTNEAEWREEQTNFLPIRARLLRRRDWSFAGVFRVLDEVRRRFDPAEIGRAVQAARIELDRLKQVGDATDDDILSTDARILGVLADHPDWTATKIANEAGVHRRTLYKSPRFKLARAVARSGRAIPVDRRSDRHIRESGRRLPLNTSDTAEK